MKAMKDDPIRVDRVKLLVAHMNPDPDAIGAMWLFMRFDEQRFAESTYYFVPAGHEVGDDELEAKELSREEVVHVDTGMGPFDHHQPDNTERNSATKLVHDYLIEKYPDLADDEALARVVRHINDLDHFAECYWPEATNDRYEFMYERILMGLRSGKHFNDREMVDFGMICMDAIYTAMKIKVSAEIDLDTLGEVFETRWGKVMAIENRNDDVIDLAQKRGCQIVIRKDAEAGHIRIKAVPEKNIDLTQIYREIQKVDDVGTWFLHPSKQMLLNGSKKAHMHVASPLTLEQVVEIVRRVGKT